MRLKDKILQELKKGDKTIPELCKIISVEDEYKMMREIGKLEYSDEVIFKSFDRISREDGGAIYLAKYGIKGR
jgi:hypothetical protein